MKLLFRFCVFFVLAVWFILIFAEWLVPLNEHFLFIIPLLKKTFSLVCHQQEQKLIISGIYHSLVCSRCAGIYFGLLFTSGISLFIQVKNSPDIKFLSYALVPMLADIFCYSVGIYTYSRIIAFITGLFLGSTGFLYFYSAINQYIKEKRI
jgi:uncharacterized membrane protein